MYILRNCNFIPELTEGTNLKHGDVVIEGQKITQIVPCGTIFEDRYEQIDLNGKTLMPGIIDMHVHLFYTKASQAEALLNTGGENAFNCLKYAKFLLSAGITTVRDVGNDHSLSATALKNAIEAGIVTGPRIVVSGVSLTPTERGNELFDNIFIEANGPMEMRKAVRFNFQKGAEFIKLFGSGAMMNPGGDPGMRIIEEDEMKEAVKIASSRGSYVAIHSHGTDAIDKAVRCGIRTIEHASFIGEETLKYMDGRRDVGIVPTLFVTKDLIENTNMDTDFSFVVEKSKKMLDHIISSLKNAYEHDILIGWGTDVQLAAYQRDPGMEFKLRKELLGFSNIEILKQATIYSAQLMMKDHSIGTVKVGKLADLIVIDGNPETDISVMYHKPYHVFRDGKLMKE